MSRAARLWATAVALCLGALPAAAQETVQVSVPGWVTFDVLDVSASTTGSPEPTRVELSGAALNPGHVVRISVRAESASFSSPAGSGIPASRVSWRAGGALGGTAHDGTLDDVSYGVVFEGAPGAAAGWVDLVWTLTSPGAEIDAGTHPIELRWKFESVVP